MPNNKIDRHMKEKYGATLSWSGEDIRCYRSAHLQFFVEPWAGIGKFIVYTFHEEIEE